jgi:hypothetical protein
MDLLNNVAVQHASEIRNSLEVEGYMKMDLSGNTNQWQPLLNITANFWLPWWRISCGVKTTLNDCSSL